MLPRMIVQDMIDEKCMTVIEGEDGKVSFDIRISRHKNKWVSPLLEDFEGFCREVLSDF